MGVRFENGKYYIDEDYIIKHTDNYKDIKPHTHDFIELSYVRHGRCVHIIDGHEYLTGKGDMVFINYNSIHEIASGKNTGYTDILIKPEFIDRSLKGSENAFSILDVDGFSDFADTLQRSHMVMNFSLKEREQLENLFRLIDSELQENSGGGELVIRSCINILLTMVFRKMRLPMRESMTMDIRMLDYIKDNCNMPVTLESVALKAGYNPSYFSRLFKNYTGTTFTNFLKGCRIERAANLLISTDMDVELIMSEVGFSDRTKFYKAFSEKYGVTPLKYRKKADK